VLPRLDFVCLELLTAGVPLTVLPEKKRFVLDLLSARARFCVHLIEPK